MKRLRMAVVGVGHLGKSHARILSTFPDVELVGVVDVNSDQAEAVARDYHTRAFTDYEPLLREVDAVTVVVPTTSHHQVTRAFLENHVPVLVEKPITVSVAEADDLIQLAESKGLPLQVGHIERFNPAFEELITRPIQPKLIESERHGPFTGRSMDIGVVLDLMIHDLDLLLSLNRCEVDEIEALGASVFGEHEDIVNARLKFRNGCIAHVTASRISQAAKRRLRVWACEGYAGIDFVTKRLTMVQPSQRLQRDGLRMDQMSVEEKARLKDEVFGKHMLSHDLDCDRGPDQLTRELQHFVQCVRAGRKPRVTGEDGREALALAERIIESVNHHPWDPSGLARGPKQWPQPLGAWIDETPMRRAA